MTIVNKLRKLIKNKGGNPIGVMTIADGVNRLDKMEEAANPLSALTIDADIGASVDLLGKYVADLQKDVVVGKYMLEGELNYIDDYTGFSGDPELQVGHYIALHAEVPDVQNVTIKFKLSDKAGENVLDPSDGILILRCTERGVQDNRTITFTAYKDGCAPYSKTFGVGDLILLPPDND